MKRIRGILLTLIIILCSGVSHAYYYKQYTTSDKLLSNTVYHTISDSKGYMWFFTDKGVSRFDGQYFKNFTGFDGLSEREAYCGYEDRLGRMWLYQNGGRVCYIQHDTVCNSRNNKFLATLPVFGAFVQKMVEAEDSSIYMYSYFGMCIKIKNGHYEWILKEPDHTDPLMTVDKWNDTIVLNRCRSRVFLKNDRIVGLENVKERIVYNDMRRAILADEDGIKVYNGKQVVFAFDDKRINNRNSLHLYRDSAENIFCSTYDGLYIINSRSKSLQHLFPNIKVSCTSQDVYGNYWVTTIGNGIYFLDKNLGKIRLLNIDDNFKLFKSNQGQVFFKKNKVFYRLGQDSLDAIENTRSDREDVIPVFYSEHYFLYKNQDSTYVHNRAKNILTSAKFNITSAYALSKDTLLMTSWDELYKLIIKGKEKMDTLRCFDGGHIIKSCLDTDKHLFYFIPYRQKKLLGYNTNTGHLTTIDSFGLNDNVTNMYLVNRHIVVLTNDKYMRLYNTAKGYERSIIDKLPFMCYELLTRGDRLILNTNKGYYYCDNNGIEPDMIKVICGYKPLNYPFKASDLQILDFTPDRVLCLVNGAYYVFNDNELKKQHIKPAILIDSILVNRTSVNATEHPEVHNHLRTRVFIKLSTLKFENVTTGFEYRIIHSDTSQWYSSSQGDIDLLIEKYGEYGIELRARTNEGVLSDPVRLELTVFPPFYYSIPFYLLVAGVVVVIVLLCIRYYNQKKRKIFENELDYLQLEHKAINSLLNPHFVFNAINNIQNLVNGNSNDRANKYLVILSRLVRQNIENLQFNFIPVDKELTLIKNYIHLQNLRFDNRIQLVVTNNIPDDQIIQIPPLLVHTFVENCVVHGFKTGIDKLVVAIELNVSTENYLEISVLDNGVGLAPKKEETLLSEKTSMGIAFMRKRLARISDFFRVSYSLEISNRQDTRGTQVVIMLYALFDNSVMKRD